MGCINNVLMENVGYDHPIAQNPAKTEAHGCGGGGLGGGSFCRYWLGEPLRHCLRVVCSTKMANGTGVVRIFDFIGWIC